jgi:hypothetical protein
MEINKENDDNNQMIKNCRKIQKCFYGLSSFGIKPPGLQPKIKHLSIIHFTSQWEHMA